MTMIRTLFGIACGALAVAASASYDLALVTDSGTDTVHRLDPVTGAYFGSFGGGILSDPRGVVVNQSLGVAYVLDATSRISAWNYSTGAFVTSFNSDVIGAKFLTGNADGTLNVTGTTLARRFSTSGATLATYTRNGTLDTQLGILLRDGLFYLSTRTGVSRSLERFNYATGAFVGANGWLADRLTPIQSIGAANTFNAYVSGTGTSVALELDAMNNGPTLSGLVTTALIDTVAGVAPGHGGMMFVLGRDSTTPTRGGIVRFDMNTLTAATVLVGTGQIVTPTGIANVVAPEPGTIAALGLGALVLLRRRRRAR